MARNLVFCMNSGTLNNSVRAKSGDRHFSHSDSSGRSFRLIDVSVVGVGNHTFAYTKKLFGQILIPATSWTPHKTLNTLGPLLWKFSNVLQTTNPQWSENQMLVTKTTPFSRATKDAQHMKTQKYTPFFNILEFLAFSSGTNVWKDLWPMCYHFLFHKKNCRQLQLSFL